MGLVLISPEKIIIEKSLRLRFSATNNEAEYETLLVGMTMVQKMGGKVVEMFSDSRLIVEIQECKSIWVKLGVYKQSLNLLTCHMSLEVRTPMQIPWQCLPPPWHGICPG